MNKITPKDRIMGQTEPEAMQESAKIAFSSATKYKVGNKEKTNTSIMSGSMVNNLLPYALKEKIRRGVNIIEYNNLLIERIIEEPKEVIPEMETVEELPKPKRRKAK